MWDTIQLIMLNKGATVDIGLLTIYPTSFFQYSRMVARISCAKLGILHIKKAYFRVCVKMGEKESWGVLRN
jgi:hypothetical protein